MSANITALVVPVSCVVLVLTVTTVVICIRRCIRSRRREDALDEPAMPSSPQPDETIRPPPPVPVTLPDTDRVYEEPQPSDNYVRVEVKEGKYANLMQRLSSLFGRSKKEQRHNEEMALPQDTTIQSIDDTHQSTDYESMTRQSEYENMKIQHGPPCDSVLMCMSREDETIDPPSAITTTDRSKTEPQSEAYRVATDLTTPLHSAEVSVSKRVEMKPKPQIVTHFDKDSANKNSILPIPVDDGTSSDSDDESNPGAGKPARTGKRISGTKASYINVTEDHRNIFRSQKDSLDEIFQEVTPNIPYVEKRKRDGNMTKMAQKIDPSEYENPPDKSIPEIMLDMPSDANKSEGGENPEERHTSDYVNVTEGHKIALNSNKNPPIKVDSSLRKSGENSEKRQKSDYVNVTEEHQIALIGSSDKNPPKAAIRSMMPDTRCSDNASEGRDKLEKKEGRDYENLPDMPSDSSLSKSGENSEKRQKSDYVNVTEEHQIALIGSSDKNPPKAAIRSMMPDTRCSDNASEGRDKLEKKQGRDYENLTEEHRNILSSKSKPPSEVVPSSALPQRALGYNKMRKLSGKYDNAKTNVPKKSNRSSENPTPKPCTAPYYVNTPTL